MIQELHWEEEPELHGSKVTATKAFQDFIEKKKTQARNLIFDEIYENVSDEKLLEKNYDSNLSSEDFTENTKQPDGTPMDVTIQDFIEIPVKLFQELNDNLIKMKIKTSKSNSRKDSFFDDETEAVLKKHEESGES